MSQALSPILTLSQGSLHPDDSISQVITPYFDQTFGYDLETHNDKSTESDILYSAPSYLLTTTIDVHLMQQPTTMALKVVLHLLRIRVKYPSLP